jgi:hypothetical protein
MVTSKRSLTTLVAAGALALAVAVGSPPSSAAPPDDTFELTADPTDLTQGTVASIAGVCWSEVLGRAGDEALVQLSRVVPPGSGLAPATTSVIFAVDDADGSFSGSITVPSDFPAGDYTFGGLCGFEDQAFPLPSVDATVTGEPTATTTTTSTTGPPSTAVPPSTAPPAVAVDGEAQLTG